MGIAAKRFESDLNENRIPAALKELAATTKGATKDLKVDFDWKSFGDNKAAMENVWSCWEQSLQAVTAVCEDKVGSDAVKKGLKKIKIVNLEKETPAQVTFKGGVLTMSMYFAGGAPSSPGWIKVQKVLEDGLD